MFSLRNLQNDAILYKKFMSCSKEARLLFNELVNNCDNNGHVDCSYIELKRLAFPYDDEIGRDEIANACKELKSIRFIKIVHTSFSKFIKIRIMDKLRVPPQINKKETLFNFNVQEKLHDKSIYISFCKKSNRTKEEQRYIDNYEANFLKYIPQENVEILKEEEKEIKLNEQMLFNLNNIQSKWEEVKRQVERKTSISQVKTWIEPLEIISYDSKNIILFSPNKIIETWILQNYYEILVKIFEKEINTFEKLEIKTKKAVSRGKMENG